jgi:hypothetical protein
MRDSRDREADDRSMCVIAQLPISSESITRTITTHVAT